MARSNSTASNALLARLAERPFLERGWSPRASVLFVIVATALLWSGMIGLALLVS